MCEENNFYLWMRPCPADESNETGLYIVVGDGRRGSVLQQEHQVAVVEVVPLGYRVLTKIHLDKQ